MMRSGLKWRRDFNWKSNEGIKIEMEAGFGLNKEHLNRDRNGGMI